MTGNGHEGLKEHPSGNKRRQLRRWIDPNLGLLGSGKKPSKLFFGKFLEREIF